MFVLFCISTFSFFPSGPCVSAKRSNDKRPGRLGSRRLSPISGYVLAAALHLLSIPYNIIIRLMELFIFRDGPTSVQNAFDFYLLFAFFDLSNNARAHAYKDRACLPTLMRAQLNLRDRSHISRGRGFSIPAADFDWDSQSSTAAGV